MSSVDALEEKLEVFLGELREEPMDTSAYFNRIEEVFQWAFAINDTIQPQLMYRLDTVNLIKSDFEERNSIYNSLLNSIPERTANLKALKYDIEHDYGKREKYDAFIEAETVMVDSISVYFDRYTELESKLNGYYYDFLSKLSQSYLINVPSEEL